MSLFMTHGQKSPPGIITALAQCKGAQTETCTTRGCVGLCRKADKGGKEGKQQGCCQQGLLSCCLVQKRPLRLCGAGSKQFPGFSSLRSSHPTSLPTTWPNCSGQVLKSGFKPLHIWFLYSSYSKQLLLLIKGQ